MADHELRESMRRKDGFEIRVTGTGMSVHGSFTKRQAQFYHDELEQWKKEIFESSFGVPYESSECHSKQVLSPSAMNAEECRNYFVEQFMHLVQEALTAYEEETRKEFALGLASDFLELLDGDDHYGFPAVAMITQGDRLCLAGDGCRVPIGTIINDVNCERKLRSIFVELCESEPGLEEAVEFIRDPVADRNAPKCDPEVK